MSFLNLDVEEECLAEFTQLLKGKTKFAIFKLSDDKKSVIRDLPEDAENTENISAKPEGTSTYDYFVSRLPENEPRFAFYNYCITIEGGYGRADRDKVSFVSWCPEYSAIKGKMIHASTKSGLIKHLGENKIAKEFQAASEADITQDEIVEQFNAMGNVKVAGKIVAFEGEEI